MDVTRAVARLLLDGLSRKSQSHHRSWRMLTCCVQLGSQLGPLLEGVIQMLRQGLMTLPLGSESWFSLGPASVGNLGDEPMEALSCEVSFL
jgi:hypothetical protein